MEFDVKILWKEVYGFLTKWEDLKDVLHEIMLRMNSFVHGTVYTVCGCCF